MGKWRRVAIMNVYAIGLFILPLVFLHWSMIILVAGIPILLAIAQEYGTPNSELIAEVMLFGWLTFLGGMGLNGGGNWLVLVIFLPIAIPMLNIIAWRWVWAPRPAWTPEELRRRHLNFAGEATFLATALSIFIGFITVVVFIANGHIPEILAWVLFWAGVVPVTTLYIMALHFRRKCRLTDPPPERSMKK